LVFFGGGNKSVGTVTLVNNSKTELAKNIEKSLTDSPLFKIQEQDNTKNIESDIRKNKIFAGIVIPKDFGNFRNPSAPKEITVIYDKGNSQSNGVLFNFLNQFLTQLNFKVQNALSIFKIKEETISKNDLTYFDFVMAGLLGLALMNSSIIGIAISITKYREDKILKRITTTPLQTWKFLVAEVCSRLIVNFIQVSLILLIAVYAFKAHIYGNLVIIYALAILGAVLFQLIGFVIASIAKTTDAAQGMATAITIPMMFLAGVFFPIDSLPKWLFSIVQFLPLAPLLRMVRATILEGLSPLGNPMNFYIVLAWIIIALALSIYKFRLTEE